MAIALAFIAFWCSWEFLHLHWQLTWPWLNLGNVFAANPKIVQWYEYTGAFGGTIWILAVNFLFYYFLNYLRQRYHDSNDEKVLKIKKYLPQRDTKNFHKEHKGLNYNVLSLYSFVHSLCSFVVNKTLKERHLMLLLLFTIFTPILISFIIYNTYNINRKTPIEAVIVQQNIDAWTEQYEKSNGELAETIIQTAVPQLTQNTVLMVCPESALSHNIREEQLYNLDVYPCYAFELFDLLFQYYPQLNIVLGLSTVAVFDTKVTPTARERGEGIFAEYYNTSCLYTRDTLQLYHKSRLVPGVEKMPYPKIFGFLEKIAIDLGGISGSLGADTEQRAFHATTNQDIIKTGAPICYESIFGELFSKFVKNGAQIMCVITNDAWWGNTPGHKQHFEMSRLRAIETRRYVLRAANTGISAFIDPLGNAHQKTKYETRTAITQTVYLNDKMTFYTKHGDYLARIMIGISVLIFALTCIICIRKNINNSFHFENCCTFALLF